MQGDVTNDQLHSLAGEALKDSFQRKSNLCLSKILEWNHGVPGAGDVLGVWPSYSNSLSASFWLYVVFQCLRKGLNLMGELFMLDSAQIFKLLNLTLQDKQI